MVNGQCRQDLVGARRRGSIWRSLPARRRPLPGRSQPSSFRIVPSMKCRSTTPARRRASPASMAAWCSSSPAPNATAIRLNMRMVTQMTDSQGQTNLTDLRSSTWEQGDGQKFRFQSPQYLNDKLGDVTMGRASRETPGAAVKVNDQPARARASSISPTRCCSRPSIALL